MERDVEMTSLSRFRYNVLGVQRVEGNPLKVNLTERTLAVGQNKSASIQIEYKELTLDWKTIFPGIEQIPELESALRQVLRPYLNLIRGVIMVVTVSKEGRMTMARNGLSFGNVPLPAVIPMSRFNSQIFSSLQAMTFPLPGEVVPYGHTWTFDTDLFIGSRRRTEAALFKMNFKYVGVRDRGGRQEAVVEINGTLRKTSASRRTIRTWKKSRRAMPARPRPASSNGTSRSPTASRRPRARMRHRRRVPRVCTARRRHCPRGR